MRLRPTKYPDGAFYPHSIFEADCFPVSAKYSDYGYFEDVEIKSINSIFDELDTAADDQRENYFAVHKVVYDHLAERIQDDSTYTNQVWFEGKQIPHSVKYWQMVLDKHISRKEQLEEMYLALKDNPDYKAVSSQFPRDIHHTTDEFRNMPLKLYNAEADIEYFRDSTLATELFKYRNFWMNMDILNKNFKPSNYASQEDNYEMYRDHLIPLMQKVCKQKDDFWEENR